jgi:hypothetical protein
MTLVVPSVVYENVGLTLFAGQALNRHSQCSDIANVCDRVLHGARLACELVHQPLGRILGHIYEANLRLLPPKRPDYAGANALSTSCDNDRFALQIRIDCTSGRHGSSLDNGRLW